MEFAEGNPKGVCGEYEIEEEVEEEVEEEIEEEVEEEEEEEEEEMGGGGGVHGQGGGGEGDVEGDDDGDGSGEPVGKRMDNSGGEEMKQADIGSSSAGKIFVGGVAWDTTEETFNEHFSKYGEITDSVIMKDKNTHMPRGFGFVTFADPSVIDKVLEDEHVIDGRMVEVKRTVPREDMPSKAGNRTRKIFVGGLPTSLTEDELKEHFSLYGEVVENQIMLDHSTGRSRGFGFVTFKTEEAVDKIISEGRMHDLAGKQVEIKRAEPKRSGGHSAVNGRASHGASGGSAHGYRGSSYGYGGSHRYGGNYYEGGAGYGYGRGYNYGGVPGYGAGYGSNYGGPMYGGGGYGGGNLYGGPGGYSNWYGGYGSGGRGYGNRYHPYGK
ncbi:unnamed protein product [Musa banksii]